jgi:hypothetical protein
VLFFVRCMWKALYEREILSDLLKGKWLFRKFYEHCVRIVLVFDGVRFRSGNKLAS